MATVCIPLWKQSLHDRGRNTQQALDRRQQCAYLPTPLHLRCD